MSSSSTQNYNYSSDSRTNGSDGRYASRNHPNITPHLLTNIPPSDNDAQLFLEVLRNFTVQEAFLQKEIPFLEATLTRRRAELLQAQEVIRQHKLALSPVRRLPTELLVEIFLHVLGSEDSEDVLELSRGLWPLSQVCGSWRSAILDHTPFWTTVYLPWRRQYPQYAVHILSLFLERSRSKPIIVDFTCRGRGTSDFTRAILGVLMSQSNRWETCRLTIPVELLADLADSRVVRRADTIRHLDLSLDLPFGSPVAGLYDIFAEAGALRSIKLSGFPNISPTTLRLPWSQLTRYQATQDFPELHLTILRLTSSLEECSLESSRPWHRVPPPTDVLHLPKLRRLNLEGTAVLLLQFLTTPNLRSLGVDNPEEGRIQSFLARSNCRLQGLEIESTPMGSDVLDALRRTPDLVKLVLNLALPRNSTVFKELLTALKYVPDKPEECKLLHLKELHLSVYHSGDGLCANELAAMIMSRWRFSGHPTAQKDLARLKCFTLETNSYWLPVFDTLKELNHEGLDTFIKLR
ncbi:hypothetical protein BT96DRAFT_153060 [Gymnopus androsaceus JB14]|uniref:F-box domain-containing protein n=1 Tax=Gymnopus androsaceus JB14 TaxID=1447944 RepID=A0A6A4I9M1_9AGAR|nr:hypothetical protein BT96DRAFT_153060 [Gymnopus androsaceus JB14]